MLNQVCKINFSIKKFNKKLKKLADNNKNSNFNFDSDWNPEIFQEENTEKNKIKEANILEDKYISMLQKKKEKLNKKSQIKIKKIKIPQTKYIIMKNLHIPKSLEKLKQGEAYKKCFEKTGYIFLAKKILPSKNFPTKIKVIPIFLILTRRTLNFMIGPKEKTMFNTINLDNIQKITQRYSNSFCFDIVENDIIQKSLSKGPISICAKNKKHMLNWITAIQEFKECGVNVTKNKMHNRVLVDFDKVNALLKPRKGLSKEFLALFYKNGKSYKTTNKKGKFDATKIITKITDMINGSEINERQLDRKMSSRIKKAEKFALDVKQKNDYLDSLLLKKQMREKNEEQKFIKKEGEAKELRLLKAVLDRIKAYKVYNLFI